MQVILLERVERLGQMGDLVTVKPGYARNFLLPQKKAMRASEENVKFFDAQKAQLEAANLKAKDEAEAVSAKIDGLKVAVIRQAGDMGQLYGSVSTRDIATAVTEAGFTVSRQQIILDRALKNIGLHDVTVKLHPEVSVTIVANIARTDEEAQIQAETGSAMVASEEEEAEEEVVEEVATEEEAAEETPAEEEASE
ncbi:50S ribosomal protein L9 [Candidatus Terasakiella magnetica]|uniref:Large ribosomal subunit protein bL9 n=1 Tax=Candidatus Terasakiella magnetica TaxID=1867952 RepID=A0A1C3RJV0_9PROT|nr:50S ribosomal protein L9 [Candidatus Terasakiella magnetica]SCA57548.1 50S ribosomal protein L9 [Candidatus Terasakiella magnetica]